MMFKYATAAAMAPAGMALLANITPLMTLSANKAPMLTTEASVSVIKPGEYLDTTQDQALEVNV